MNHSGTIARVSQRKKTRISAGSKIGDYHLNGAEKFKPVYIQRDETTVKTIEEGELPKKRKKKSLGQRAFSRLKNKHRLTNMKERRNMS